MQYFSETDNELIVSYWRYGARAAAGPFIGDQAVEDNHALHKAKFQRDVMQLGPPMPFRVIDCRSTMREKQVVLIDWHHRKFAYSAISHTFGMDVYGVFNCPCAAKCLAKVPRSKQKHCPGHGSEDTHLKTVQDILKMCKILTEADIEYAWHDGVCIAQHDEAEVSEAIKHMGWVYANAKDTIIFLHYVGNPVAPICTDEALAARWHTRVWTIQEAVVSPCRRYCVRMPEGEGLDVSIVQGIGTLEELDEKARSWYEDDCRIKIIEEEEFAKMLLFLFIKLSSFLEGKSEAESNLASRAGTWKSSVKLQLQNYIWLFRNWPCMEQLLVMCSERDSKHDGDRVNSLLALAGVRNFEAPKDKEMEKSTIEFFKRQEQEGLARAVYSINITRENVESKAHSWVPSLMNCGLFMVPITFQDRLSVDLMKYQVLADGTMELSGELVGFAVRLDFKQQEETDDDTTRRKPALQNGVLFLHAYPWKWCYRLTAELFGRTDDDCLGIAIITTPPLPTLGDEAMEGSDHAPRGITAGHLVFPRFAIENPEDPESSPFVRHTWQRVYLSTLGMLARLSWSHDSLPALLLTNLDSQVQVSKVGVVYVSHRFLDFLRKQKDSVTTLGLSKIVIQ